MKRLWQIKGFTLMEMLIVVAIIAILVAIAIPTLSNAVESSRQATDNANIRAALEELIAQQFLSDQDEDFKAIIPVGVMKADWDKTTTFGNLPLIGDDLNGIGWTKGQNVYLCWEGELGTGHAFVANEDGEAADPSPDNSTSNDKPSLAKSAKSDKKVYYATVTDI